MLLISSIASTILSSLTPAPFDNSLTVFMSGESISCSSNRIPALDSVANFFIPQCPVDIPPSPKKRYRSTYQYPGWEHLEEPGCWETLSDYDVLLRLVDFSGLRDVLAQRLGWTSAKGQVLPPTVRVRTTSASATSLVTP